MQNKNYFAKWIYRDVYIIIRRRDLLAYAENRAKEREYEKTTNESGLTWQYNNGNYFLLSKITNDNIAHQLIHKSEQLNYEDLIFPVDVYYSIQVVDKETGFIFYSIIEKNAYTLRKQYINIISVKTNKGATINKMYKTEYRKLTYNNQTVLFGKRQHHYLADRSVIQSENGPIKFNEFIDSFNRHAEFHKEEKFEEYAWIL